MNKVSQTIKKLLMDHGYDNHVIVVNNGEIAVTEMKPYGRVEVTSHGGTAKQLTVTENIRI